jgi:hypothetical protein
MLKGYPKSWKYMTSGWDRMMMDDFYNGKIKCYLIYDNHEQDATLILINIY